MKKLVILIMISIMLNNCDYNTQMSEQEKNEVYKKVLKLNSLYETESEIIVYNSWSKRWEFLLGQGLTENRRIKIIEKSIKKLESLNIASADYLEKIHKDFKKTDTVNLGILLTSHKYGDQLIRLFPKRANVFQEYSLPTFEGDEKIMSMSEEEFSSFIKDRIRSLGSSNVFIKFPYTELSTLFEDHSGRRHHYVNYYFIKNKNGEWLLNDIKIEEQKN